MRRYATNVNQAVKALNASGQAPEWLASAVAITDRAVRRLDSAADEVASAARRRPPRRQPRAPAQLAIEDAG